ncbi:ABC transporter permease [Thermotoga profunda]|uniref:ABC transporter permease n=1 Tax=Thermotoga profunda TaxID=1508420 RepID=UPI00069368EA|nr:ABC transporter permease [Thermotoga profunda]
MKIEQNWFKIFFFTVIVSFLCGSMIISLTSENPLLAMKWFYLGPISNTYFFGNTLSGSIPLILTGLGAVIAFSAGTFNLGLEGQLYFGTLCATFVALHLTDLNREISIFLILSVAFVAGGLIGVLCGFLKVFFKVNELLSSYLISQALIYIVDYFLNGPLRDPFAGLSASRYISNSIMFSKIMLPSDLHSGIFLALALTILIYFIMQFSSFGYQIKVVGSNYEFARYGGIKVSVIWLVTLLLSGGLAGLGGIIDVLGVHGRMIKGFSFGYGFNGIAVALIARNNPIFVIPSALLFSYLEAGAQISSIMADVTPEISKIIQATIFYLITAEAFVILLIKKKVADYGS